MSLSLIHRRDKGKPMLLLLRSIGGRIYMIKVVKQKF